MDATVERTAYRFRRPLQTAYGTLREREVLVLTLRDDEGRAGRGEAAPLFPYDGVTLEEAEDALRSGAPGPAPARAARDVAELDLRARREGRPVAALLRASAPAAAVPVNATVAATDRTGAAREAAAAVEAGFRCVKLKVGVGDDAGRVAAVRAAVGPDAAIRVDANGAWSVEEAVAMLRALAPAGIELCEEPVHGAAGLAEVRERLDGEVALAMDETAREPGAIESGACEYVCLKVAGCGGISGLWAAAERARGAGSQVYVASTYDGPAGIAAGLHAAAALGEGQPACGLATLSLFADLDDPFPPRDGRITVPEGPGLGVSL